MLYINAVIISLFVSSSILVYFVVSSSSIMTFLCICLFMCSSIIVRKV